LCNNSAFIDNNNDVYICGDASGSNQYSLGDGLDKTKRTSSYFYKKIVFPLDSGDSIIDVVICGSNNISCLALSKNGKMYSWGINSAKDGSGLLGHGDSLDKKSPTLIDSMKSVKVVKIYACNVAADLGAFGCIDNQGYAYGVGRNIPALSNDYRHDSTTSNKFTLFPIKNIIDMRLYSDDNDNECGSVSLLDKDGRVFVIGESQGYSNGTSGATSTFTELNLTS
jgi:alpha-tubulin suppressor-like RCC1 family protein